LKVLRYAKFRPLSSGFAAGLPDFLGETYQNGENMPNYPKNILEAKYAKRPQNIPNGHEIYQKAVHNSKWP
jgi:hypothetical protein